MTETDTSYQGIAKICSDTILPKKRAKKHPLSKDKKRRGRPISSDKVFNERAIGWIKRFKTWINTVITESASGYALSLFAASVAMKSCDFARGLMSILQSRGLRFPAAHTLET